MAKRKSVAVGGLSEAFNRLSGREKGLVGGISAAVLVGLIAMVVVTISGMLTERQGRIEDKRHKLDRIVALEGRFDMAQAAQQRIQAELRRSPTRLFPRIEELGKRYGVEITDMNERPAITEGEVQETAVEVNIRKVAIDTLTDLLYDIESSRGIVKVNKLRIKRAFGTEKEKLLQVSFTVSSYQEKRG